MFSKLSKNSPDAQNVFGKYLRRLWNVAILLTIILISACSSGDVTTAAQKIIETQGTSISQTPGSCVATYAPKNTSPIPDNQKWYPVSVATSHRSTYCPKRNVQIVELRGWIHNVILSSSDPGNADDPDLHYDLEVDSAWAVSQGIDLNQLFRVGNLFDATYLPSKTGAFEQLVATPMIHVELWGWRLGSHPGQKPPSDWGFTSTVTLPGYGDVVWPFNPFQPLHWQFAPPNTLPDTLKDGQYVRMVGSLVTDDPHDASSGWYTFWCRNFGLSCGSDQLLNIVKQDWDSGFSSAGPDVNQDSPARWTEIHPPDLISLIPDPRHHETLREVALYCSSGDFILNQCTVDEDIPPPTPCTIPEPYVGFQEIVGTAPGETDFSTIIEGNGAGPGGTNTGAKIDVFLDRIHVHVRVKPKNFGPAARFKALYRVFCTATTITSFVGVWRNVDPHSGGWVRIEITAQGNTLFAHLYGGCTPTPCDAGSISAPFGGNPVHIHAVESFATRDFTLSLMGNTLHVTTFTHFTDNSGRSDYTSQDDFHQ